MTKGLSSAQFQLISGHQGRRALRSTSICRWKRSMRASRTQCKWSASDTKRPTNQSRMNVPTKPGSTQTLLADAGFFSAANVAHCEAAQVAPLIARRRDQHYLPWYERLNEPAALPSEATAVEHMLRRLKTAE